MAEQLTGRAQRGGDRGESIALDPVLAEVEDGRQVGARAERPAWQCLHAQAEATGRGLERLLADNFTTASGGDKFAQRGVIVRSNNGCHHPVLVDRHVGGSAPAVDRDVTEAERVDHELLVPEPRR